MNESVLDFLYVLYVRMFLYISLSSLSVRVLHNVDGAGWGGWAAESGRSGWAAESWSSGRAYRSEVC